MITVLQTLEQATKSPGILEMSPEQLQELFAQWQGGTVDWQQVEQRLRSAYSPTIAGSGVLVDMDRVRRCGFPEVVFGEGKSADAIISVFRAQVAAGQNSFATRMSKELSEQVCQAFPAARANPIARTVTLKTSTAQKRGRVVVVTAGTSDRPVAEEALETVLWMGCDAELLMDIGVAGPQRLLANRDRLQNSDVVVVVAGMEGALPSVVAGWVSVPVIAVPTSVGYGANLGGFSALLSMLNSCAANVAVVNIDAGFKGGYLAAMIARQSQTEKKNHD